MYIYIFIFIWYIIYNYNTLAYRTYTTLSKDFVTRIVRIFILLTIR